MPRAATRTWLELTSPSQLEPTKVPAGRVRVELVEKCPPSFWRYLYTQIGQEYHWVDRLPWSDDEIRQYLEGADVQLWLLTARGAPAGYFELRRDGSGGVEIAYFGLLREFIGHGLGGYLLTEAARAAWTFGANRVWLHTSTLDHPAALTNYLSRGFVVVRREDYVVPD